MSSVSATLTLDQRPSLWERVFFVLSVTVYYAEAFLVGDQPEGADALNPIEALTHMSTQGDPAKQLLLFGLYATAAFALVRKTPWRAWSFLSLPLIMLSLWPMASMAWSIDPEVSLRRSGALLGTVTFGLYLGLRFDLRTTLRLMSLVTAIVLVSSVLVAVIRPELGLDFEGRLRGVTVHKNAISGFASISFLMLAAQLTLTKQDWLPKLRDIGLAILCIVCMLWSESAAAIPMMLFSLPFLAFPLFLRKADRSFTALIPLLIGLTAVLAVVAADNYEVVTSILGKSSDMSGRTQVWAYALKMFWERPLLGYGYETFWEGAGSPGGVFWSLTGLGVPHSHNGYIQLALDGGLISLVMFVAAVLMLVYRLGWLTRYGNEPLVGWPMAFLALFLVTNLSETRLWVGNGPFGEWFVYTVVAINVATWRSASKSSQRNISSLPKRLRDMSTRLSTCFPCDESGCPSL